jgi:iron complex outermembrane recepter protein
MRRFTQQRTQQRRYRTFPSRVRGISALLILSVLVSTAPAGARTAALILFSISPQALSSGVIEFSREANVQVLTAGSKLDGVNTHGVKGRYSITAGMRQLLAGTGFHYNLVGNDTIALVPPPDRTLSLNSSGAPAATRQLDPGVKEIPNEPGTAAPNALAKESVPALQEVLVTATKRTESQREVPIAITALGQSTIERLGPSTAEDAMRFVPGVDFSSNGSNSVNYTIRGVNTGTATGNVQSTVAVYVDDMSVLDPYYPKITTNPILFDINRIEVLKGPQGTLFGSGALGGAIRIITNKPDLEDFTIGAETGVSSVQGGSDGYSVDGVVNMPLVSGALAMRVVGYDQHDAGYVDNLRTGERDVNSMDTNGGRVQLLYAPIDSLRIRAEIFVQNDHPADSPYTFYGNPNYTFNGYLPNRFPQDLTIYSLTGEYDAGFADLTSITNYSDKRESSLLDFTATSMQITGLPGLATIGDFGPSTTFSQEVRLVSRSAGPIQWLVGGIFINNHRTVYEQAVTDGAAAVFGSDYLESSDFYRVTHESALFGEVSYKLLDELKLTAGLRAFTDQIGVNNYQGGAFFFPPTIQISNTTEHAVTPKFAATYTFSPQVTLYAQAAKGYRIGQPNVGASEDLISGQMVPPAYKPDSLWNYELGAKTGFLDNRLTADAAVYYIDWRNIQLASLTSGEHLNYISNAGDALIRGAELELRAAPTDRIEFGTSVSFIDSAMTSITNGAAGYIGQRLPASARYTTANYLQYSFPLRGWRAYARIDQRYISSEIDRLGPGALTYGNFDEFNLRTGIDFGHYEAVLYLNNVTNGDAAESALTVQEQNVAIRQQPRTVGLTFRVRY